LDLLSKGSLTLKNVSYTGLYRFAETQVALSTLVPLIKPVPNWLNALDG
jgi:hypothetical protein